MCVDPKSTKKTENLTVFFALLGYVCAKAAHRTLMKLIRGVNFTNMFAASTCEDPKSTKKGSQVIIFFFFALGIFTQKGATECVTVLN